MSRYLWHAAYLMALGAAAAVAEPRIYLDSSACQRDGQRADACMRGYAQARSSFDIRAPRFATRELCEQRYRHCMVVHVFAHGGVDFTPALRGFTLVAGQGKPVSEAEIARPTTLRAEPLETPAPPPGAYPLSKAMLQELQARRRRYIGAGGM